LFIEVDFLLFLIDILNKMKKYEKKEIRGSKKLFELSKDHS